MRITKRLIVDGIRRAVQQIDVRTQDHRYSPYPRFERTQINERDIKDESRAKEFFIGVSTAGVVRVIWASFGTPDLASLKYEIERCFSQYPDLRGAFARIDAYDESLPKRVHYRARFQISHDPLARTPV